MLHGDKILRVLFCPIIGESMFLGTPLGNSSTPRMKEDRQVPDVPIRATRGHNRMGSHATNATYFKFVMGAGRAESFDRNGRARLPPSRDYRAGFGSAGASPSQMNFPCGRRTAGVTPVAANSREPYHRCHDSRPFAYRRSRRRGPFWSIRWGVRP